jgi:hypothetical protein
MMIKADHRSAFGMTCVQCDNEVIAPEWSEYRSKHDIVETGNDSWRFKSRTEDHTSTRARPVSAIPTISDGANASRSKRKTRGSLLDADLGSRSNAD